MTIFSVGDSVAAGVGSCGMVDKSFSRGGIPVGQEMCGYFQDAASEAKAGDTVIISAGYNGGDVHQMVDWIKPLTEKGVNVRILGLREKGLTSTDGKAAPYAHLDGKTAGINNNLREVAAESGAVFSEDSILVANTIPGHEIHGNFSKLAMAALQATPEAYRDLTPRYTSDLGSHQLPERTLFPSHDKPPVSSAYLSKEQLSPMSREQVGEVQELLHKIDLQVGSNRYDLGHFGHKIKSGEYDGKDYTLGSKTSHSIQDFERIHGLGNVSAEELIATLKKTAQMHSEPAELPTSPSNVLQAKNDVTSSKVRI